MVSLTEPRMTSLRGSKYGLVENQNRPRVEEQNAVSLRELKRPRLEDQKQVKRNRTA